ncbi:MAG TPA: lysophospholipid acyltransferase family protein [Vicinamibacterales bacterium]
MQPHRRARGLPRVNPLTTCWTAVRVAAPLLGGLAESFWVPRLTKEHRDLRIQLWARRVLKALRVQVKVVGTPQAAGPMLVVSNHISWLDILALHATCHCRFVAKSNVRRWPLIGRLATAAGTFYVDRESRQDARRMVQRVANALTDGEIIAVFPEGTTGDGRDVLPFHSNLIQSAILAEAPAQPVSLQFIDGRSGELCDTVSYMGEDSLVASIWRTMGLVDVRAVVTFGAPEFAQGRNRRAWAEDLRREISSMRQRR